MTISLVEGRLLPFKLVRSETVPLTRELVKKMREMRPSPVERDLQTQRVDFLRARYEDGLFHPPHWVIATVAGLEMRANGQHSSEMLIHLNGNFPTDLSVHIDYFDCVDMDALVALFRQFDDRRSSRSPADVAGAYQGLEPALAELPRWIGKVGSEGIGWHRRFVEGLDPIKGDDVYAFMQDESEHPFYLWLGSTLVVDTGVAATPVKDLPVIAAMYATFQVDADAAGAFWGEVVSGGKEFEEDFPTTALADWLKRRKRGEFQLKPAKLLYQGCIYTWNAYRDGRVALNGIKSDVRRNLAVPK